MITIIAGSRSIKDWKIIPSAIKQSGFIITEIVSGGAYGVDQLGEYFAGLHSIPVKQFLPDWKQYGKAAGPIRNKQMALYADALIAVWDGESRGTKNMIAEMKKLDKLIYIFKE